MREILFRGKAINRDSNYEYRTDYKNGDWVYGLITKSYDERFSTMPAEMRNTDGISGIEVDYKTVGQYTGFTDKNGIKIFEGDILEGHYDCLFPNDVCHAKVIWHGNGWHLLFYDDALDDLDIFISHNACVVGNIYDEEDKQ